MEKGKLVKTFALGAGILLSSGNVSAFTSNPMNPGNPLNYVNPLSPWCHTAGACADDEKPQDRAEYKKQQEELKQNLYDIVSNPNSTATDIIDAAKKVDKIRLTKSDLKYLSECRTINKTAPSIIDCMQEKDYEAKKPYLIGAGVAAMGIALIPMLRRRG